MFQWRCRTELRRCFVALSCGWELSRAISHLWSDSASTKSRLSRVSERLERASVYLKCGAGTSRHFLLVYLTGTNTRLVSVPTSLSVSKTFNRSCTYFGQHLNRYCDFDVHVSVYMCVYSRAHFHKCNRHTDDGLVVICLKITSYLFPDAGVPTDKLCFPTDCMVLHLYA